MPVEVQETVTPIRVLEFSLHNDSGGPGNHRGGLGIVLGREVLTAGVYGVTPDYNVFVSVSVVPNLIRQLFADAAISAAFVPVLTALLAAGDLASRIGIVAVYYGSAMLLAVIAAFGFVRQRQPV